MKLPQIDGRSSAQTFTVTSGALRVTDPCYDMDTWCAGTLDNVKNGQWAADVGYHKDALDEEMGQRHLQSMRDELEVQKKTLRETLTEQGLSEERIVAMIEHWFAHRELRIKESEESMKARLGRVAYIRICHADHALDGLPPLTLDDYEHVDDLDVGVDSGQAGFFDLARYEAEDSASNGDFYNKVCRLTCDSEGWFGVVEFGAVSSSGYGDGGYDCFVAHNADGQIIAAVIVFLAEYDEEGESEEDTDDAVVA